MKKIINTTALLIAIAILTTSFGNSNDDPAYSGSTHEKTIQNMVAAITGETDARAKYIAFSIKATEEGFLNIAKLFLASAEGEVIHARNHNLVLQDLGLRTYHPTPNTPVVLTTMENLQAAIEGETYEFEVMYPAFIADARNEQSDNAVESFLWALGAEIKHARFLAEALEILKTTGSDKTVPSRWYVCPKCGDLFDTIEGLTVSRMLCRVDPSTFLIF